MSATPIAIAVVEQDGRFLIGRRPEGAPLAGLWEFPGGKIEAGESPEAAAERECAEEAGVEVQAVSRYPAHVHDYDHGRVELFFVACRTVAPQQSPREPFRWVRRGDLKQYQFPEGNRGILQALDEEATQ